MNFPLPIPSVTTVNCFTPLHVDTKIEYTLDMEKFQDLREHHWEPALVISPHDKYLSDVSHLSAELMSSSNLISVENLQELSHLMDTYDICNLQEEDADFGFTDLPAVSQQSPVDTTGLYLESSLTNDSMPCEMAATDISFANETEKVSDHQSLPKKACSATGRSKRKRSVSVPCEQTETSAKMSKRNVSEYSDYSAQYHNSVCVLHVNATSDWFREAIYPTQTSIDAESRQW